MLIAEAQGPRRIGTGRGPVNLKSALLPMPELYFETPIKVKWLQAGLDDS